MLSCWLADENAVPSLRCACFNNSVAPYISGENWEETKKIPVGECEDEVIKRSSLACKK